MKKILIAILSLLVTQLCIAQAGGAKIRFTAKKSLTQLNQFQIYAKNVSSSTISGNIGASLVSLCIGVPRIVPVASLSVAISTTISGLTFAPVLVNDSGTTRIYTWNGTGLTVSPVVFDPNVEVLLATVTFNGVADVRPIKLMNVIGQGPSFFDNNFIAPNGIDQCDYSNPFYSNVTGDPNLRNCNGTNDVVPTCTSTFTVNDIVLPTKFLSFYANKSDDNAKLTWTVDNEEDNSYFEVEASTDARTFTLVQKVSALRNGRSSNTYNLADNHISRYNVGTIYYRIKQVEASGRIIYSDVRQVSLDSKNFVAALYPNPVRTITKLMIEAPEAGKATVIIRDAAGKAVKQLNLQLQKGANQQEIDASALAAGDYNVTIVSEKLNQTIKLTKSN